MDKSQYGRRDRLMQEKRHDAYKEWGKLSERVACAECGAVFLEGRWCWKEPPDYANKTVCPACQRIADNYPAGQMVIEGLFFEQHRQEILNLIHNEEKLEKGEHPMERIMSIVDEEGQTLVNTTGIHLARRLGEALARAYQGDLDFKYGDAEQSIRVTWSR